MPSDSCAAARSAAAEISNCSLAVRSGAVERAVVQPAKKRAHSKRGRETWRMGLYLDRPPPKQNPIYPSNYCNARRSENHDITKKTGPAGLPTGPALLLYPTSSRTV